MATVATVGAPEDGVMTTVRGRDRGLWLLLGGHGRTSTAETDARPPAFCQRRHAITDGSENRSEV